MRKTKGMLPLTIAVGCALLYADQVSSQSLSAAFHARDPGVRPGAAAAGEPLAGITAHELEYFLAGKEDFEEAEDVADGLGPTMNLDGCGGCHSQPAIGGSSPPLNPQVAFATRLGARNILPTFIRADGPVREARFVKNADGSADGGVHALFTIAGRSDAPGCNLAQEDFAAQQNRRNVVFRIPTPLFGAGLMEQIPDAAIRSNAASKAAAKQALGIRGVPNRNGNDGTIARFGWKAQNKSLLLFAGEAYNVEMGISNELFQNERDESATCNWAGGPNDAIDTESTTTTGALSAIQRFAVFQRLLAPPVPSADTPGGAESITRGKGLFTSVGCAYCHTPSLMTGNSTIAALRNQTANLYSDLLVHDMGPDLADGVAQGQANGRSFRTAPLWGLGQRVFFLHDGRSRDLLETIAAHKSGGASGGSEANAVVGQFNNLAEQRKQDLVNFLRSL